MLPLLLCLALAADSTTLPPLPEPPDLPTEALERWIHREGLSELEADQVRQQTKLWVRSFREYESKVAAQADLLMEATLALPVGSEERWAKAMEVHALCSEKVDRQRDLVRRIRRLVTLRGEWHGSGDRDL